MAAHAYSASNWVAMHCRRHMELYGTTKEQLGWMAINSRRNAALNPLAAYRDPITMDDYLTARPISSPLGLFDCDVPVDGSIAVVVSHRDYAPDCPNPPVRRRGDRWRVRLGRMVPPRRLPEDGLDRGRRRRCGRGPTSRRRTSTSPSSTTASRISRWPGWRRSASAVTARRVRTWKVRRASRWTASCR